MDLLQVTYRAVYFALNASIMLTQEVEVKRKSKRVRLMSSKFFVTNMKESSDK